MCGVRSWQLHNTGSSELRMTSPSSPVRDQRPARRRHLLRGDGPSECRIRGVCGTQTGISTFRTEPPRREPRGSCHGFGRPGNSLVMVRRPCGTAHRGRQGMAAICSVRAFSGLLSLRYPSRRRLAAPLGTAQSICGTQASRILSRNRCRQNLTNEPVQNSFPVDVQ